MKPSILSVLTACGGFVIGYAFTMPEHAGSAPPPSKAPTRKSLPRIAPAPPATRMQSIAETAATLATDEWPAFFRSQLAWPESARLTARLWAEADPAGFWAWLREDFDRLRFEKFAPDLLREWASADPDAAMDAVAAITDKQLGDALRRKVIDTVLDQDVFKGVELAARAGDFNRFSWGARDWMVADPAAAVTALATLPAISDYRRFLQYVMPIWAEKDPGAALNWMTSAKALPGDQWMQEGFAVAAKANPSAALAAARSIADSRMRGEALAGVIASGQIDLGTWKEIRGEIPLDVQRRLGRKIVDARPAETSSDLLETARLLEGFPLDPHNLSGIDSLASQWARVDAASGWRWAQSLSQPAARRKALTRLAASATPQQVAEVSLLDLSDAFFKSALRARRPSDREAWIGQLPPRLAAWAESVNP